MIEILSISWPQNIGRLSLLSRCCKRIIFSRLLYFFPGSPFKYFTSSLYTERQAFAVSMAGDSEPTSRAHQQLLNRCQATGQHVQAPPPHHFRFPIPNPTKTPTDQPICIDTIRTLSMHRTADDRLERETKRLKVSGPHQQMTMTAMIIVMMIIGSS